MNTELIIYFDQDNRSAGFYKLDLREDIAIPVTYSIADIREPGSRKSDFTKTVTLPGTKNNNNVLGHLYEIGADSWFDPRKKKACALVQDGMTILDGYMELTSVKRDDYYVIEYEVTLYGTLANIFQRLKVDGVDRLLEHLDLDEWIHEYEVWNVKNSWDTSVIHNGNIYNNFVYGTPTTIVGTDYNAAQDRLIIELSAPHTYEAGDKVRVKVDTNFPYRYYDGCYTVTDTTSTTITVNNMAGAVGALTGTVELVEVTGEGYVYPMINYSKGATGQDVWSLEDFRPAVYMKTIWDRIFAEAGFTYESEFLNSQYFKRLIMPSNLDVQLTDADMLYSSVFVGGSDQHDMLFTFTGVGTVSEGVNRQTDQLVFVDETTDAYYDFASIYDNTTGEFTAPSPGKYQFEARLNASPYIISVPSAPTSAHPEVSVQANLQMFVNGVYLMDQDQEIIYPYNLAVQDGTDLHKWTYAYTSAGQNATATTRGELYLQAGDVVTWGVSWRVFNDHVTNAADVWLLNLPQRYFKDGATYYEASAYMDVTAMDATVVGPRTLYPGGTVRPSTFLPRNFKQADFLTSVIKMFNLYVETDKTVANKLYIEPRPDFYTDEKTDWTSKLDTSKPLEINPMGEAVAKDYRFTYALDKDWKNNEYNKNFDLTYGEITYRSENEFIKADKEVKLQFASTPPVDETNDSGERIIPWIVKDGLGSTIAALPRVLHYNGMTYGGEKGWLLATPTSTLYTSSADPTVQQVVVVSPYLVDIYFSQEMDEASSTTLTNYNIVGPGSPGNPVSVTKDQSNAKLYHAEWFTPMNATTAHTLFVSGMTDTYGHTLVSFSYNFYFYQTQSHLYPAANCYDRPQDPTVDLNFGPPVEQYFDITPGHQVHFLDNNLYNRYYSQFIDEITDKDSKVVTGWFYLTPTDVFNLDFKRTYIVDGHHLRLHAVKDYNAKNPGLTKVEFLKVKSSAKFVPNITLRGFGGLTGGSPPGDPVPLPPSLTHKTTGDNLVPTYTQTNTNTVVGNDNTVGNASSHNAVYGHHNHLFENVTYTSVSGVNNTVQGGGSNIVINGNNNTVLYGLSNVSIIGMDNVTATQSNVAYINGVFVQNGVMSPIAANVDAGLDVVLTFFGGVKPYQVVDAGLDVVLNVGSLDPINVVDAA